MPRPTPALTQIALDRMLATGGQLLPECQRDDWEFISTRSGTGAPAKSAS